MRTTYLLGNAPSRNPTQPAHVHVSYRHGQLDERIGHSMDSRARIGAHQFHPSFPRVVSFWVCPILLAVHGVWQLLSELLVDLP